MIPSNPLKVATGHELIETAWQACATDPGALEDPAALARAALDWLPATVPSTAAAILRSSGRWSLDGAPRRFDGEDWWYRARFSCPTDSTADEIGLSFEGLATIADVWLNGTLLLSSQNMFVAHERRLGKDRARENELVIRFRALDSLLSSRRPRPRWRAPMVEHQQLRWFRTTLLGRTPGWSPPAPPVGPWRPIRIERRRGVAIEEIRLEARVDGNVGRVEASCRIRNLDPKGAIGAPQLVLERDGIEHHAPMAPMAEVPDHFGARVEVAHPELWWPHTHGVPTCYRARIRVRSDSGPIEVDLGPVGFRKISVDRADQGFAVHCNGVPIFCRGACWTPLDPVSLASDRTAYETAVVQAREAGMNMIRVPGTMVYENDDFLELLCEHGMLLWQDFMFANMDYPADDAAFVSTVTEEARQELIRLSARPCLAVLCGNSEGEQQAAMWGAPRERWRSPLFHETLAGLAAELCPDVPYWPSSAHGGAFPHQAHVGTTSYYGVGAYLRPLTDARRAEVRFATECLAFANVPSAAAISRMPEGPGTRAHHPRWKARTPRDLGAGWDFDDVRDHYLECLYRIDPVELRYADHERYLALGRIATGEVMAQVLGEWRRKRSSCRGALIWFLRDLWLGAGWGLIDAEGTPKAAYHLVRRALQPVAMHWSDEGGNGLALQLANELPRELAAEVEVALYRAGEVKVSGNTRSVVLPAHESTELDATDFFDGFVDLSYAYRFGPPSHDLVVATLRGNDPMLVSQAFHFPLGLPSVRELDVGLAAQAQMRPDGSALLTVHAERFAQSVSVDAEGFNPSDNYFHIAPGAERRVVLSRVRGDAPLQGTVQPLNAETAAKIGVTS